MLTYYLLFLVITFGNLWMWRIFKENLLLSILLVILSFLFLKQTVAKVKIHQLLIFILVFVIISFLTLRTGFDKNIFVTSPEDLAQLNKRHGYYADELGPLYTNKFSQQAYKYLSTPIRKIEKNLFSSLDINLYFFASHPRERGTGEFVKYSWVLLLFFILGFFSVMKYYKTVGSYFIGAAFFSMLLGSTYPLGPVLFFPLINVLIVFGLISIINFLKRQKV